MRSSRVWTAGQKAAARQRSLDHPEWITKAKRVYADNYPDRVLVYEEAMKTPQPCDKCGGPARPMFALNPYRLAGWCCVPCRGYNS